MNRILIALCLAWGVSSADAGELISAPAYHSPYACQAPAPKPGLLQRWFGPKECCQPACEPACCEPVCETSCPEPCCPDVCCDPCGESCGQRCCPPLGQGPFRKLFRRRHACPPPCCDPCHPECCEAAPCGPCGNGACGYQPLPTGPMVECRSDWLPNGGLCCPPPPVCKPIACCQCRKGFLYDFVQAISRHPWERWMGAGGAIRLTAGCGDQPGHYHCGCLPGRPVAEEAAE